MSHEIKRSLLVSLSVLLVTVAGVYFATLQYPKSSALGGEFTLQSVEGLFSLSELKGKVVVLFFGYTSCPDTCPLAFSRLEKVLRQLPEEEQKQVVPVFISVDYKRDKPEKVQKYSEYFYLTAVGLTGSKEQIDTVTKLYGTYYLFEELEDSKMGYAVQHSTRYYLIDKNGKLQATPESSIELVELRKQIKTLL